MLLLKWAQSYQRIKRLHQLYMIMIEEKESEEDFSSPHTKNWFLKNLSEVKIMRNIEKTRTVLNKVSFLGDTVQGSEGEKIAHSFSNLISSSTFQSVWITATWVLSLLNFLLLWKPSFPELFSLHFYLSWFVTHQQYFYHPSSFLSCF